MVNPSSIRLKNSNNAVDDGGITGVDSAIDSSPRIHQNQRLKRQLFQLTHDNDVDLNDGLYQSYQESPAAQRLVLDGGEYEQSQFLFKQPPDEEMLPPDVFLSC
jgi:hypothetical protein